FVAIAGTIVLLAPALTHSPFSDGILGDIYLYPALIAPGLALATWMASRSRFTGTPYPRVSVVLACCVVLLLAAESYAHTFTWNSSRELYARVVKLHPKWPTGYIHLVEARIAENEMD